MSKFTSPLQIFAAYLNFETNLGISVTRSATTRRTNLLAQICAQNGLVMQDYVYNIKNCNWASRKKQSDSVFFVPIKVSEIN